jgi:DNA-binding NarL/FixJ family response regulator
MTRQTVLVIAGHPLLRHGVRQVLEDTPYFAVSESLGNAADARTSWERNRPDFVVLDLELGGAGILGVLRDFRTLDARVLVLSEQEDASWARRVFRAGAQGYVSKWEPVAELPHALMQMTLSVEPFASRRMSRVLVDQLKGVDLPELPRLDELSNRELEVFRLVGAGSSTGAMARQLGVSVKTIETHFRRIRQKLECSSGVELKEQAVQWVSSGGAKRRAGRRRTGG